jgi:hypothetical protein
MTNRETWAYIGCVIGAIVLLCLLHKFADYDTNEHYTIDKRCLTCKLMCATACSHNPKTVDTCSRNCVKTECRECWAPKGRPTIH